jgi:hypothetical protein
MEADKTSLIRISDLSGPVCSNQDRIVRMGGLSQMVFARAARRRAARPRDGVDRRRTYQSFGGHVRAEQGLDDLVMGIVNLLRESLI